MRLFCYGWISYNPRQKCSRCNSGMEIYSVYWLSMKSNWESSQCSECHDLSCSHLGLQDKIRGSYLPAIHSSIEGITIESSIDAASLNIARTAKAHQLLTIILGSDAATANSSSQTSIATQLKRSVSNFWAIVIGVRVNKNGGRKRLSRLSRLQPTRGAIKRILICRCALVLICRKVP